MKIAIVDDEQKWRKEIKDTILKYERMEIKRIDEYISGDEFLAGGEKYSIVFMDIEMPGEDGFEITKKYKKNNSKSKILITTTHTEMSRKGYTVEAFRYIDKMNIKEEIKEALDSICEIIKRDKNISLNIDKVGEYDVKISDIRYFETHKRKLLMHIKNQTVWCNENITDMEKKLVPYGFYMTHRSYLINMRYVADIKATSVNMENGDMVFLSRRRSTEFRKTYTKYIFGESNR